MQLFFPFVALKSCRDNVISYTVSEQLMPKLPFLDREYSNILQHKLLSNKEHIFSFKIVLCTYMITTFFSFISVFLTCM